MEIFSKSNGKIYVTFGDEKSSITEHLSQQTCYPRDYLKKIQCPILASFDDWDASWPVDLMRHTQKLIKHEKEKRREKEKKSLMTQLWYTLSSVTRSGQFFIFRWPLAMLYSGWSLMCVCHEDLSCKIEV